MYQSAVIREADVFHSEVLTLLKRLTASKTIFLKGKLILVRTDISAPDHSDINVIVKFYITKFTRPKYVAAVSQLLRILLCYIPVLVMKC